jgi:hypothetical protein
MVAAKGGGTVDDFDVREGSEFLIVAAP